MWVGSSSSACAAALGLPVRKGSTSTRVSPSASSKQAWPRKRISTSVSCLVRVSQLVRELPADGHAHEHPHPGLFCEQCLDPRHARVLVRLGGGRSQLGSVRALEPAALV